MTVPGKGGKPAWIEVRGDPRKTLLLNLYESQVEWLKEQTGGAAEWVRTQIEAARSKERKKRGRAK